MKKNFLLCLLTLCACFSANFGQSKILNSPIVLKKIGWSDYIWGSNIGASGSYIGDLDGDGTPELIIGGNSRNDFGRNDFWQILTFVKSTSSFIVKYRSQIYGAGKNIVALNVFDIDSNGRYQIVLLHEDGTLELLNTEGQLVSSVQIDNEYFPLFTEQVELVDVYGDDESELLILNKNHVAIIDLSNGLDVRVIAERSERGYGANHFVVADVDGDSQNEIIDGHGHISSFSGENLVLEGKISSQDALVGVMDVDGDSVKDVIFNEQSSGALTAYSVVKDSVLWVKSNAGKGSKLKIADLDGDNSKEIILGSANGSKTSIYTRDGVLMNSFELGQHGIDALEFYDFNGDNYREIIRSSGGGSSGPDTLQIMDAKGGLNKVIFETDHMYGPFTTMLFDDLDSDNVQEFIASSAHSSETYKGGIIKSYDPADTFKLISKTDDNHLPYIYRGSKELIAVEQGGTKNLLLLADYRDRPAIYRMDSMFNLIDYVPFSWGGEIFGIDWFETSDNDLRLLAIDRFDDPNDAYDKPKIYSIDPYTASVLWELELEDGYFNYTPVTIDKGERVAYSIAKRGNKNFLFKMHLSNKEYEYIGSDEYKLISLDLMNRADSNKLFAVAVALSTSELVLVDIGKDGNISPMATLCKNSNNLGQLGDYSFLVYGIPNSTNIEAIYPCDNQVKLYSHNLQQIIWKSAEYRNLAPMQRNAYAEKIENEKITFSIGSNDRFELYESVFNPDKIVLVDTYESYDLNADESISGLVELPRGQHKKMTVKTSSDEGVFDVDEESGRWTFAPKINSYGEVKVQIGIFTRSEESVHEITFNINGLPVAKDDAITGKYESKVKFNVLSNDYDIDGELDWSTFELISNVKHGSLDVLEGGEVEYTPNEGFYGIDEFQYRVRDDLGAISNIAKVTIDIPKDSSGSGDGSGGGGSAPIWLLGMLLLSFTARRYYK